MDENVPGEVSSPLPVDESETETGRVVAAPRRRRWATFVLGFFSVVLSLILLELGVRLFLPPLGGGDIEVRDAEIGKTLRPEYEGVHLGVVVRTNAHGLRSPEIPLEKPEGTERVLVLGDSWTFGVGVEQEKTYPARLQRILDVRFPDRKIEVINTGVSGYETFNESVYFKRSGYKFEPDIVVIGFYPVNDLHDKKAKYERHARERAAHPIWYPIRRFPKTHMRSYQYIGFVRSRISDTLRSRRYGKPVFDAGPEELDDLYDVEWTELYSDDFAGWVTAKESLADIATLARSIEARVVLAVFPDLRSLTHYRTTLRRRFFPTLEETASDLGIEVFDVAPSLYEYEGREEEISLFETKGSTHPNAKGYDLIATALADHLFKEE